MKKYWKWSLTVALAGFLFGFDTVVISGATNQLRNSEYLTLVSRRFYYVYGSVGTVVVRYRGDSYKIHRKKKTLIWIGLLIWSALLDLD